MSNPLDDLFSPERLRKNWQRPDTPADAPPLAGPEPSPPQALLKQLRDIIYEKYADHDAAALDLLIDEFENLLNRLFPEALKDKEDTHPSADEIPAVHEALNRIEDLVEAFELDGRTRR